MLPFLVRCTVGPSAVEQMAPLPASMQVCWTTGSPVQIRCAITPGRVQSIAVLVHGSPFGSRPTSVIMSRRLLCSSVPMSTSVRRG